MNIIKKTTPNFTKGRDGYKPEAIVIHIMAGSLAGTDSWFANPASKVSSHYGLGLAGDVHQYVDEADQAYHAGTVDKATWTLIKPNVNPNKYTIGIEHEGQPDTVWSDIMKKNSAQLICDISKRWNIPLDRKHVIGHYEIRSSKPNCPATNKKIIDELLEMAIKLGTPASVCPPDSSVKKDLVLQEVVGLLAKALDLIKSIR